MPETEQNFRGVSLNRNLVSEIEKFIQDYPEYKSIADFVHEATRVRMEEVRKGKLPRFEKINSDENGVKILDRSLADDVEVYIKPTGIVCGYDKTDDCDHVRYALSFPEVRELIRKLRKDGWKLPEI
jgi:hypothetical protein